MDPLILVFDVDGVLVGSQSRSYLCIQRTVVALSGVTPSFQEIESYKRASGWNDDIELAQHLCFRDNPLIKKVKVTRPQVVDTFLEFWDKTTDTWIPKPGLLECLYHKHVLAIFSGRPRRDIRFPGGVETWFWPVIGYEDVEKKKPNPEGLLAIIECCAVEPERVIYLGDTPDDYRAAAAARISFIWVGKPSYAELSNLPAIRGKSTAIDSVNDILEVLKKW